ncbi:MAG: agmatine deiminase family protein [Limnothrix sp.]
MAANSLFSACNQTKNMAMEIPTEQWWMPDEMSPHTCTWMAFRVNPAIWDQDLVASVQNNLAAIARTIAAYEPVNMLVQAEDYELAATKCGKDVNLVVTTFDDFWVRDTGPVFVTDPQGKLGAIDFNFNGWGNKQSHENDAEVAQFITQQASAQLINTHLVLEGGGIEVDGAGTAIITESCVLNRNRNPGLTKADCEAQLKWLLGIDKVVWLLGLRGHDITDGHTDFYARFAAPGVVVAHHEPDVTFADHEITKQHLEILRAATDSQGKKLEVVSIPAPSTVRSEFDHDEFAAGYINFYGANGLVLAPEFGDRRADANAKAILTDLFPEREIIQLNIDAIAAGGGGIHCVTQQQPEIMAG